MIQFDEELWFGEEDSPGVEEAAAASMAAVAGRVLGARPFPVAAKRLEELTRSTMVRLDEVVRVLEGDPGLSTRLLRLVNSAGYGLRVRCTSLRHAATLVGTRRLHQIATTAAILDMFDSTSGPAVRLLEHLSVVGAMCRYLAVHLGLSSDALFKCGFLHDIGKLMLLETERDAYAALLAEHGDRPGQMHIIERERYGFDHSVLGAHVLKAWNIPDPVPKVVAWHHRPARAYKAGGVIAPMVQVLRLADLLSYAVTEPAEEAIAATALSESATYLEISEVQLAAMWSDLKALHDRRLRSSAGGEADLVPRDLDSPGSLQPGALQRVSLQVPAGADGMPLPSILPIESRRAPAPESSEEPAVVSEVPKQFPCVVCAQPTFGHRCWVCSGNVCPDHIEGNDQRCAACAAELEEAEGKNRVPTSAKIGVLAGACLIVALAGIGAAGAPEAGIAHIVLGQLLALLACAIVVAVAYKWWVQSSVTRTRRLIEQSDRPTGSLFPEASASSYPSEPPEAPVRPADAVVTRASEAMKFATAEAPAETDTPARAEPPASETVRVSERAPEPFQPPVVPASERAPAPSQMPGQAGEIEQRLRQMLLEMGRSIAPAATSPEPEPTAVSTKPQPAVVTQSGAPATERARVSTTPAEAAALVPESSSAYERASETESDADADEPRESSDSIDDAAEERHLDAMAADSRTMARCQSMDAYHACRSEMPMNKNPSVAPPS